MYGVPKAPAAVAIDQKGHAGDKIEFTHDKDAQVSDRFLCVMCSRPKCCCRLMLTPSASGFGDQEACCVDDE